MDIQKTAEANASESPTGSRRGKSPNSLANLRPFRPGQSGNPSGLTKDGRSTKGRALEASLLGHLEKSGGMDAIARAWIKHAKRGSAAHLAMILDRIYPVEKDQTQGRMLLEGIKLELSADGSASATLLRGSGGAHVTGSHEPLMVTDCSGSEDGATREVEDGTPGRGVLTESVQEDSSRDVTTPEGVSSESLHPDTSQPLLPPESQGSGGTGTPSGGA